MATTLANNGGPTQTLAPLSGSPVLGAGTLALANLPTVDQRGLPRSTTGNPDDGAFPTQTAAATQIVNPPSQLQAALTIAIDTAAILLQGNPAALLQLDLIDQVFLHQVLPPDTALLFEQILADLPYAGFLAGPAIQAGASFAQAQS